MVLIIVISISPSFSPYLHHSLPDGAVNVGRSLGVIMRVYLSLLADTDLPLSTVTHWRPLHFLKNKPALSTPTQGQGAQVPVIIVLDCNLSLSRCF